HVAVPAQYVGDVMGDLSSRRGRVGSSEAKGATQVIQAQVPMSEMLEYASALTSITGGQGEFHMEFHHYDEAPSQVRERVVAEAQTSKPKHCPAGSRSGLAVPRPGSDAMEATREKIQLKLSPQAEKSARRDAPLEVRRMAARGALPLPPLELATVLFALMHDPD